MSFIGGLLSSKTSPDDIQQFVKSPGLSENNPFTKAFNADAAAQQAQAGILGGFANNGAQGQSAAQQQAFVNQLMAQANGQGPSAAQAFLNIANDQNMSNANSLAASARGNVNPMLANRMAMQQNAQSSQQAAQMGALARIQEQQQAQGMLGSALTNMRGQDIQNSGMQNQMALGYQNLAANNRANGLNAANMNLTQEMNANNINASIATGNNAAQNAATGNVVGGVLGGAGQMGAAAATGALKAGVYTGGVIPGRSEVNGDSPKNDTVPAMLSPGEIVIPKSMASDAEKAKAFVDHLMSNKTKSADKTGYANVLEAKRMLQDINKRLKKIESKVGKK